MFKQCLDILKDKKVILCVSGGVDSMVLLYTVCKYREELNISPVVCHFEHGIRGAESQKDMELVERKCKGYGIPVIVKRENIPELCTNGENLEETARNRRYAFFRKTMAEQQADGIVVAHHKGDNCETVLMNIIRGCGIGGLCGMKRESEDLLRPFLAISKNTIYEYAHKMNIEYREDKTNADTGYFRNSIRHNILPLMKEKNPKIDDAIDRLREIAAVENDFMESCVAALGWIIPQPYGYDIGVSEYLKVHEAIKRRAVFYVLKMLYPKDYDYKIFEDISLLTNKDTGKMVCSVGDVCIYKEKDRLCFVKDVSVIEGEYPLKEERTETPFGVFYMTRLPYIDKESLSGADSNTIYMGICDISGISVRSRRKGDRISGFGGGTKKLKDVLIDKKVPVFLRDSIPVVVKDNEILWVPGIMRSKHYPVQGTDGICLCYEPKQVYK